MDYERILKRSWQITKTHKFLWVFGLVLASLSGGSINFGGSGSGGKSDSNLPKNLDLEDIPDKTQQVLGAATDTISDYFNSIPIATWIVIAVVFLIAVVITILISLYIREWARGSLIASFQDIDDEKETNLQIGAKCGKLYGFKLMSLHIFPSLIFWGTISIIAILLFGITMLVRSNTIVLIPLIVGESIIGGSMIVVGAVMLTLTILVAEQRIVRYKETVKAAFVNGFRLVKSYVFQMIGLAAIHLGLGCAVGCVSILIIAVVTLTLVILFAINTAVGFIGLAVFVLPLIALIIGAILLQGMILVFKTGNWTLLVKELEEPKNNK